MSVKPTFFAFLLLAAFFVSASRVLAAEITVWPPRIVVTPQNIHPTYIPVTGVSRHSIDAPLTSFTSGGVRYWFNSWSGETSRYRGTLDAPFQSRTWTKSSRDFYRDPTQTLGGPWRKISDDNWTFGCRGLGSQPLQGF